MKSKLILCSMVLGCSMGLMAQQSNTAPGSSPGTTPPTFPQDQSQQQVGSQPGQVGSQPNNSTTATDDQMGQQSSQTGQMGNSKSSEKQKVEGCLSGTDGNFTLTDKSGTSYQLQGENSELAKHVGQEVRVEGMASASTSAASSSSEASPSGASSANALTVSKVKKVSDSCPAASGGTSTPKQ